MGMILVILAALATTTIPAERIDKSWGVLTRSTHLRGSWLVSLDDGTRIAGDWIVINREHYIARDFGGGGGPHKSIYLVDSKHATVCAFDADKPYHLYCTGGLARNVRVPDGVTLAAVRGSTPLDTYQCANYRCEFKRGGTIDINVKPAAPSLADEHLLFERTTGYSLAKWLSAVHRDTVVEQRDKGVLVLELPFRDTTPNGVTKRANHIVHYAQSVIEATATVRIGPQPTQIAITVRETARYIEDCSASEHAASSCMPKPPSCERRR